MDSRGKKSEIGDRLAKVLEKEADEFQHYLVRLVSLLHCAALQLVRVPQR